MIVYIVLNDDNVCLLNVIYFYYNSLYFYDVGYRKHMWNRSYLQIFGKQDRINVFNIVAWEAQLSKN